VERAKGLLQVHYEWTEEDAYYHLRRTSRQQRTPMAVIAQMVIDVIAAKEAEGERMSA
jgi:AmiR/NasT family two-component response regulator